MYLFLFSQVSNIILMNKWSKNAKILSSDSDDTPDEDIPRTIVKQKTSSKPKSKPKKQDYSQDEEEEDEDFVDDDGDEDEVPKKVSKKSKKSRSSSKKSVSSPKKVNQIQFTRSFFQSYFRICPTTILEASEEFL